MKFFTLAAIAATFIAEVSAGTRLQSVWVAGVDQGAGAIRQPSTSASVKNLTSTDIRCNGGNSLLNNYVSVPAGGSLTAQWYEDSPDGVIIEPSHDGPITAYLGFAGSNGVGPAWVKVFNSGHSDGTWATEKLRANQGKADIPIPAGLRPGRYILRTEIIDLQGADVLYLQDPARGAEFYPTCVQVEITGDGSTTLPSSGVSFPGAYTDTTPGIVWNINDASVNQDSYPVPGPAPLQL